MCGIVPLEQVGKEVSGLFTMTPETDDQDPDLYVEVLDINGNNVLVKIGELGADIRHSCICLHSRVVDDHLEEGKARCDAVNDEVLGLDSDFCTSSGGQGIPKHVVQHDGVLCRTS